MDISNKVSEINDKPKISIVVPAYNIENYLPRCLDSILAQSYDNIEIVLVDDGSTDRTGEIADKYQTEYPSKIVCIHLENGGVLRARMLGIKASSGDWIGFVDGDDEIEADMYERLMENAINYNADISHCGYQTIVNDGERIHYFYNTGRIVEQDKLSGLKDLLSGEFVEPGLWNKLFRKALFSNLSQEALLKDKIKINEDLLMNYLLFKHSIKSIYEDFCPYHYMARNTSATRSVFNEHKVLDPVKVKKFILNDVDSALKSVAYLKYLLSCMEAYVKLHGKEEYKEKSLEFKQELINHREQWGFLRKNDRIKLRVMLLSPVLYKFVYGFYEKFLQRKVYE